jgi:hypothetical protein
MKGKLRLKVKGGRGIPGAQRKAKLRTVSESNYTIPADTTSFLIPIGDGLIAAKGRGKTRICASIAIDGRDSALEKLRIVGGAGAARGLKGTGKFLAPSAGSPGAISMKIQTKRGKGGFPKRCAKLLRRL